MGRPWIKLSTATFDDEKIKLIELLPEGDSILVIWLKLLCFAGKTDNDGVFKLTEKIPYNEEMLAGIFNRKLTTVRTALKVFQEYGMMEVIDGAYALPNWVKYQNDSDALNKSKEKNRIRQKKWYDKHKKTLLETTSQKPNVRSNDSNVSLTPTEPDIDLDKDKDKEPTYRDVSTIPVDKSVDNFSKGEKRAGGHLKDFDVGKGILAFTDDCELRKSLRRWSEMRAGKGKPLNPKTFQRNMDDLRQLSLDPEAQKTIVDKSTEKGWIGFYPLDKVKGKPKKDCPFCHGSGVYQGDDGKFYICNCKED